MCWCSTLNVFLRYLRRDGRIAMSPSILGTSALLKVQFFGQPHPNAFPVEVTTVQSDSTGSTKEADT